MWRSEVSNCGASLVKIQTGARNNKLGDLNEMEQTRTNTQKAKDKKHFQLYYAK